MRAIYVYFFNEGNKLNINSKKQDIFYKINPKLNSIQSNLQLSVSKMVLIKMLSLSNNKNIEGKDYILAVIIGFYTKFRSAISCTD